MSDVGRDGLISGLAIIRALKDSGYQPTFRYEPKPENPATWRREHEQRSNCVGK